MNSEHILKFHKDGHFRILHMTDIQEGLHPKADTVRLMEAALDAAKPDVVVVTGDQIKGYAPSLKRASGERIEALLNLLMRPMTSRNIPIAVTFGNHDCQCGVSNSEQMKIYDGFLNGLSREEGPTAGTFSLPVLGQAGQEALRIYLMDSGGDDAENGGYEPPSKPNIDWLRQQLHSHQVPGVLFQHIPLPEYKKCKNVVIQEPICSPKMNVGEFAVLRQSKNVLGVFCGHDHKNDFIGSYEGIDLGYTPSCGFACYGPGVRRGCRLLEFHEETLPLYKTEILRYETLVSPHTSNRLKEYWDMHIPTCWPTHRGEEDE